MDAFRYVNATILLVGNSEDLEWLWIKAHAESVLPKLDPKKEKLALKGVPERNNAGPCKSVYIGVDLDGDTTK